MANPSDDGLRSDGFLSRWARRKQDVLAGKTVAEPVLPQKAMVDSPNAIASPVFQEKVPVVLVIGSQAATENVATADPAEQSDAAPALTLEDASALTPASDFKPFMARSVSPEVKNAAMKKLFADPHYNVMDMMDTYVDDYSKSDPIPESMLRELASAKFLRLFERDEEDEEGEGDKDGKPGAPAPTLAPATDAPASPGASSLLAEALPQPAPEPIPADLPMSVAFDAAPQSKTISANPL
jgi:Protein of unknown function (DUF3306)